MKKMYDEISGMDFPARTMTKEQQARILERAMECIEEERAAPAPTRRRPRFRWKFATAAAALCCLCAGGVAAAGYFLSPAQVAGQMEQTELSALFAGPDTVEVQQTQQGGNYTVTLLGLTSGGNVTGYWSSDWGAGAPPADRSYAVVAVAHTDGTPMAALDDEKSDVSLDNSMVSPLLAAPDYPAFQSRLADTVYGRRLARQSYSFLKEGLQKCQYAWCRKWLRFSTDPALVMLCYLYLERCEVKNLEHIIEGVHYGMPAEELLPMLIGCDEKEPQGRDH